VAVVGGLLVSQMLTLFITPVVYLYLDRLDGIVHHAISGRHSEEDAPVAVVEPAKPRAAAE